MSAIQQNIKSPVAVGHVRRDRLIALNLLAFAACVLTSTLNPAYAGTSANPRTPEEAARPIADALMHDIKAYIQIIAPLEDEALGTILYGVGRQTLMFGGPR